MSVVVEVLYVHKAFLLAPANQPQVHSYIGFIYVNALYI